METADFGDLVGRSHSGFEMIESQIFCNSRGGALVVSREHDDFHTEFAQADKGFERGSGSRTSRQPDWAQAWTWDGYSNRS
jgi:hypothetical protein